ncbi:MAG: TetR/AcrR family transcriptional regulator [Chloroflexi bacterium]|nr:TetR/AcrR family transcriptional regulator [Chloroflexota bacterium]
MELRKAGRPPEDRLVRRMEIYRTIAPLLQECGMKRLSMRDAAKAACLSIGGLYHYFPTKRDMALFPLNSEVRAHLCREFKIAHTHLAERDPRAYLTAFVDNVVNNIFLVRPAVLAARDLGAATLWSIVEQGINDVAAELLAAVKPVFPEATEHDLLGMAKALRQIAIGAIFDSTATSEQIRKEVRALVDGHRIAAIREQRVGRLA